MCMDVSVSLCDTVPAFFTSSPMQHIKRLADDRIGDMVPSRFPFLFSHSCFAGEETEAQRLAVTWPRSQKQ